MSENVTLEWHYDSPSLTQCVRVPIINDECVEEKQEEFIVSLSSDKECVIVGNNETTITIQDDDSEYTSIKIVIQLRILHSCIYTYSYFLWDLIALFFSFSCAKFVLY